MSAEYLTIYLYLLQYFSLMSYSFQCTSIASHYYCSVAKLFPILCDPMNYGPKGSSVHVIFQARIQEWVAISFSLFTFILGIFSFLMKL